MNAVSNRRAKRLILTGVAGLSALALAGCASGGASGAAVSPPSARIATSLMTSIYGG